MEHFRNFNSDKSLEFSVRIVNLNKHLKDNKHETVLSKQILHSRTFIGANLAEAQHAQSQADFLSKMSITLREANETIYWLRLLKEPDTLLRYNLFHLFNDN
jgi:four helix bundle protein